jgi:plastocyanin
MEPDKNSVEPTEVERPITDVTPVNKEENAQPPLAPQESANELNPDEWFKEDSSTSAQPASRLPGKNKLALIILVIGIFLLLGTAAAFFVKNRESRLSGPETNNQNTTDSNSPQTPLDEAPDNVNEPTDEPEEKDEPNDENPNSPNTQNPAEDQNSDDDEQAPSFKTYVITYSNSCYSPSNITVKNGDVVKFVNKSTRDMWPASDKHPHHDDYPAFDSNGNVPTGGSYSFKFTKTGTWGFHDHLKPSCGGSIVVK